MSNYTKRNSKASKDQTVPHGLRNQGATCYLNSVLQVLFWTPETQQVLEKKEQPSNSTDQVLKALFTELKKGVCETKDITKHLQIHNVCEQRDAAQYLELILKNSKDFSEPFHGELLDRTECSEGHCIIEEPSKFWTLPLPLSDCSSVTESFRNMFKEEKLEGSSFYCNTCQRKTGAKRRLKMTKFPQVLVLLLKKFDIDHRTGSYYKSHCKVEISKTLQTQGHTYSLCGVVDHRGGLWGGHYTATIQSHKDRNWYQFSDTSVCEVNEPRQKSSTAYLLIYRDSPGQEKKESTTLEDTNTEVNTRDGPQQNETRQEERAPPALKNQEEETINDVWKKREGQKEEEEIEEVKRMKQEMEEAKRVKEEIEEVKRVKEEVKRMNQEMEEAMKRMKQEMEEVMKRMKQEVEKIKQEMERMKQEEERMKQEMEKRMKQEMEEAKRVKQEEVKRMKQEMEEVKRMKEDMEEEVKKLKEDVEEKVKRIKKEGEEEVKRMKKEIEEVKRLKKEIEEVKRLKQEEEEEEVENDTKTEKNMKMKKGHEDKKKDKKTADFLRFFRKKRKGAAGKGGDENGLEEKEEQENDKKKMKKNRKWGRKKKTSAKK